MNDHNDPSEVVRLLREIRDDQRTMLVNQGKQIEIIREQAQRSKRSIEESIALQRTGLEKQKQVTRIAIPGVVFCMALVVYLIFRYL